MARPIDIAEMNLQKAVSTKSSSVSLFAVCSVAFCTVLLPFAIREPQTSALEYIAIFVPFVFLSAFGNIYLRLKYKEYCAECVKFLSVNYAQNHGFDIRNLSLDDIVAVTNSIRRELRLDEIGVYRQLITYAMKTNADDDRDDGARPLRRFARMFR